MPQAIPALFSAVIGAAGTAIWAVGSSAILTTAVVAGTAWAASAAMRANTKGPSASASVEQKANGRLVQSRVAAAPRRAGYGRVRCSGPLTYIGSEGATNRSLYFIFPIFDHHIKSVDQIEFDGERLPIVELSPDNNGIPIYNVASGRYQNKALIKIHLGDKDQLADDNFESNLTDWDTSDRGRSIAYLALILPWDEKVFDHRPHVTVVAQTKDEIREPRSKQTFTSSDVDSAGTTISITGHGLEDGDKFKFGTESDGDLGTVANDYDVFFVYNKGTNDFQVIASETTSPAPTPLDFSSIGTGTHAVYDLIYTENNALCAGDFWESRNHGFGASYSTRTDEDDLIASANTCETDEDIKEASETFTADHTAEEITLADEIPWLIPGNMVQVEADSGGALPTGLSDSTDYYWIDTPLESAGVGQLATSYQNAMDGVAVAFTSNGSGTLTLTRKAEIKYGVGGTFDMDEGNGDVMRQILAGMAGAAPYYGGKLHIFAGEYTAPTIELDDDDLVQMVRSSRKPPADARFNAAKGVFINPEGDWQPDDLTAATNATYLSEDGGREVFKDIEFLFTTSAARGQRLLKVALERHRQGIQVRGTWKYSAYRLTPFSTVGLTNSRAGWNNKAFEVVSMSRTIIESPDGPYRAISMILQETASTVYDWNSGEETTVDPSPDSNLPSAFEVTKPANVTISSAEPALFFKADGTAVTRMKIVWDAITDNFVLNGGKIEFQYRDTSSGGIWLDVPPVLGDQIETYVWEVKEGEEYEVQARAVNQSGVPSDWGTSNQHTIVGDTVAPAVPTSITAEMRDGASVFWGWVNATALDFARTIIQVSYDDTYTDPESKIIYSDRGTSFLFKTYAEAGVYYRLASVDLSGNQSAWTASTFVWSGPSAFTLKNPDFNSDESWYWRQAVYATEYIPFPSIANGILTLDADTYFATWANAFRMYKNSKYKLTVRAKKVGAGGTSILGGVLWIKKGDDRTLDIKAGFDALRSEGLVQGVDYAVDQSIFTSDSFTETNFTKIESIFTTNGGSGDPGYGEPEFFWGMIILSYAGTSGNSLEIDFAKCEKIEEATWYDEPNDPVKIEIKRAYDAYHLNTVSLKVKQNVLGTWTDRGKLVPSDAASDVYKTRFNCLNATRVATVDISSFGFAAAPDNVESSMENTSGDSGRFVGFAQLYSSTKDELVFDLSFLTNSTDYWLNITMAFD